jgi:hypothetical protein
MGGRNDLSKGRDDGGGDDDMESYRLDEIKCRALPSPAYAQYFSFVHYPTPAPIAPLQPIHSARPPPLPPPRRRQELRQTAILCITCTSLPHPIPLLSNSRTPTSKPPPPPPSSNPTLPHALPMPLIQCRSPIPPPGPSTTSAATI